MTDQTAAAGTELEAEGDGEADAAPKRQKVSGKKLALFVILPILLIGMSGAGIYFSGLADSILGIDEEGEGMAEENAGPSVYYDIPEMLVNLNSSGRKTGYLKISVSLEVATVEDFVHLDKILPRIIDSFQVYLRELRVEDLRGSAGLQRLREELLLRVAHAAEPAMVKDVLFREMLIQ